MAGFEVNGVTVTDAVGGSTWTRMWGEEGASEAAAVPKKFVVLKPGRPRRVYAPSSRNLTLADTLANPLTSTSAGTTILKLLTHSMFGVTRDPSDPEEIEFAFQTGGLGPLLVTPSVYRGAVASQAAMVALSLSVLGDWVQRTDASNAVYQLTTAGYATAGNWTVQSGANRPRIFFGAVANEAAMIALSTALPGDWVTRTDDSATVYQLQSGSPGTAGNWATRVDADKPTTPQIRINWNNLDPQYLPQDHPPVLLTSKGYDSWVAS